MIPHVFAAVDHLEDARRHIEEWVAMGIAAFQQQHAGPLIDKPGSGH